MPWWSTGSGRIELAISRPDAACGYHQGQCDADVEALVAVPYIAKQLAKLDPELLARELAEWGAWDETELSDHEANLRRIVWLACGDIFDGHCD